MIRFLKELLNNRDQTNSVSLVEVSNYKKVKLPFGVLPNIEGFNQRLIKVIKIDDAIKIAKRTVKKVGNLFLRLNDKIKDQ